MVSDAVLERERPFGWTQRLICLYGIVWRESLRFLHQRERFISALVRPLVWLFIFAAGFRQTLGVSIMPPYDTYVLYEVYIAPGLIAMIQLFNGMQSSLSMVYDREMGSMRMLLVSPAPRWFLLTSKLIAGVAVSILQVYAFLIIAYFWEIEPPTWWGYLTVLPALALSGLMLGALGMLLSSLIKQQHARPVQERPRDLDPPHLTAGKEAHLVACPVGETHAGELDRSSLASLASADAVQGAMVSEVLRDAKVGIKRALLKDDPELRESSAAIARDVATENAHSS